MAEKMCNEDDESNDNNELYRLNDIKNFKIIRDCETWTISNTKSDNNDKLVYNNSLAGEVEKQISESLDQLTTASTNEYDRRVQQKRVRVGNHYQAKIPKYYGNSMKNISDNNPDDKLLWNPANIPLDIAENFLKKLSSLTKLIIPMGNHLRDNEQALYILHKHNYNVDQAIDYLINNTDNLTTNCDKTMTVWTAEECKNFELGFVRFGKNFYLIQKKKVNSRKIGELVQFYYLWKKTERYDLFAHRIRGSKKKYSLNPGMSDLMNKYLRSDVQSIETNLNPMCNFYQFN